MQAVWVVASISNPFSRPLSRLSRAAPLARAQSSGALCTFERLQVRTGENSPPEGVLTPAQEVSLHDLTPGIEALVASHGLVDGVVNVISQHTTTGLALNEFEFLLREDVRDFMLRLAPPQDPWRHNDLQRRPASDEDYERIDRNWMSKGKGTLEEFMEQEPKNAHAHICSMLFSATLVLPVMEGSLMIGEWQSVILADFDAPRLRQVGVQLMGQT